MLLKLGNSPEQASGVIIGWSFLTRWSFANLSVLGLDQISNILNDHSNGSTLQRLRPPANSGRFITAFA